MNKKSYAWLLLLPLFLLGACRKSAEHAKYIPKDALMVAEVNTRELSKKIAWSMITNTNLWEKLTGKKSKQDSVTQSELIKNMQEAGVDELNTFYAYLKNDGPNAQNACFVALIPLKDAPKWEGFVKKTFGNSPVKETGKRKEAKLDEHVYAGWTNNLLILVILEPTQNAALALGDETLTQPSAQPDMDALMASQLESAFSVSEDRRLLGDKRFAKFQKHAHDFGLWINLEAVISNYGAKNLGAMTGGLSLSDAMWRNSAFAAAANFEKGRVNAEMWMYSSTEMDEINKQYNNKNVDADMVKRVPNDNLDYILAYRMSPEGTQKTIEKMGMLGLANGYLQAQNLTIEEILSAFTGDMVFALNNFKQTREMVLFDSTDASSAFATYKTDMDMLFAVKINKQPAFQKLLGLALNMQVLEQVNPTTYRMRSGGGDSSFIVVDKGYAVFGNKPASVQNFMAGTYVKKPAQAVNEHILNYPFGMFFDFNKFAKRNSSMQAGSKPDSLIYQASVNLFDNVVFNGGKRDGDAFKYVLNINLVNQSENSLLQLAEYAKVLQEAQTLRTAEAGKMMQELMDEQAAADSAAQ